MPRTSTIAGVSRSAQRSPAASRCCFVSVMPPSPELPMWLFSIVTTSTPACWNAPMIPGRPQNVNPSRGTGSLR